MNAPATSKRKVRPQNPRHQAQRKALVARLNEHAQAVCEHLLPNGTREGNEWRVGSPAGEVGHSMAICLEGEKTGLWADFGGEDKDKGDLLTLWTRVREVRSAAAIREAQRWLSSRPAGPVALRPPASVNPSTPVRQSFLPPPLSTSKQFAIDWHKCQEELSDHALYDVGEWRGYSPEFCIWLRRYHYIGLFDGNIAFPMHEGSAVVGVHYYYGEKKWIFKGSPRPLIVSAQGHANLGAGTVHIFESQWDGFAYADLNKLYNRKNIAVLITRGAPNGKLIAGLIPKHTRVYAWPQNDELRNGQRASDGWLADVIEHAGGAVRVVVTPAEHKDLNDWTRAGASVTDLRVAVKAARLRLAPQLAAQVANSSAEGAEKRTMVDFFSPLQIQGYQPAPDTVLIGDCHVVKGSVVVIGGPPGVGKSRAATALAVAGATGKVWFGLKVHAQFRTLILQNENGRFRLKQEYADLPCDALEPWIRVSAPPPLGFRFDDGEFIVQLRAAIADFKPGVVILDPWNAAAQDDKARDYHETFEAIRAAIPAGDDSPALVIVAHTRKPKGEDRVSGRGLLNLLAGSYVLGSVPRSVFVMQPASDDPEDPQVVWTCCKNNDGEMGPRSAWERRNGLFTPVPDFDWKAFAEPASASRCAVSEMDLLDVFELGARKLKRAEAARLLMEKTKAGRAACYNALRADGRFGEQLIETDGMLEFCRRSSSSKGRGGGEE